MNKAIPKNYSTPRKIWLLLAPGKRRRAMLLLGLMFITMLLETVGVGAVVPVIGLLMKSDMVATYPILAPILAKLGNPNQQAIVIGTMLGLLGIFFVKNALLAFSLWQQTRFAFGIGVELSQRLFTAYLHQPYTFHLQRNSAQLLRNVLNEVGMFSKAVMSIMTLLTDLLVLAGLCCLLLIVEPLGAIVVTLFLGIAAWSFHHVTRDRIAHWGIARQHHEGLRIQHLQQGLGGAKDVKLLGREGEFLERYRFHNTRSAHVGELQALLQQLPRLWLELLAVSGLVILVCSMVGQNRAFEVVLPTLGLFAAAAFRIMPSVGRVLNAVQVLRYLGPVVETMYTEFQFESKVSHRALVGVPFSGALELQRVSYTYPGAVQQTLKDVSLIVRRGEFVGFVGTSGAGKSTLVDVVLGLLPLDSGEILVDGSNIQIDLRNWQNQIGYVPQSIFLTDDTLRRNIAFGLPDDRIQEESVWRAVDAAQLKAFVATLPDGLDTVVGERGIRLSGGQRQRIGIARALYHNPAILFLDEATSALDNATEQGILDAVCALRGEKTVLIVAHRLSTVQYCDRIFQLEGGKIVEEARTVEALGRRSAPPSQVNQG